MKISNADGILSERLNGRENTNKIFVKSTVKNISGNNFINKSALFPIGKENKSTGIDVKTSLKKLQIREKKISSINLGRLIDGSKPKVEHSNPKCLIRRYEDDEFLKISYKKKQCSPDGKDNNSHIPNFQENMISAKSSNFLPNAQFSLSKEDNQEKSLIEVTLENCYNTVSSSI